MRKQGFGVVNAHQPNGIHRGTGMVIALNDMQNDNYRILSKASAAISCISSIGTPSGVGFI